MNNDSKLIFEAYTLNGLAKGKTVEDVAKKHGVQVKDIENQIEKGVQVEHEHTGDEQTARKIAMDHVFEDPKYYDKLSKIESKSENEEQLDVAKYKAIIDDLSKGGFDTESKKDQVDQGSREGVFDVEVVDGKRQVVLTNAAVKKIETEYPELKGKFWECGKCKADYAGCGEAKREQSEDAEMPANDFNKLKQHINKGPIQIKKPSKELPYTHKYIHGLAKQDPREDQREENAEDANTKNWIDVFHRTFGPGYKEEMEKGGQDPYEFFVDYYIAYLKNPEIVNKFAGLYNAKYPSHQVDLARLHKEIDKIKDKPLAGYKAPEK